MNKILIVAIFVLTRNILASPGLSPDRRILKVPGEFPTIAEAVANSNEGDWIIISPGDYSEYEVEINKAVTISSEWKISGDESKIEQTIIDPDDKRLFIINADGVEISGLKIINGDHTLDISAKVTIMHNRFIKNLDGMSFESGGGGYVGYNTAKMTGMMLWIWILSGTGITMEVISWWRKIPLLTAMMTALRSDYLNTRSRIFIIPSGRIRLLVAITPGYKLSPMMNLQAKCSISTIILLQTVKQALDEWKGQIRSKILAVPPK